MDNILVWDWKYKIFFDVSLGDEIDRFIDKLENEEKNIYREIRKYYLSFFSMWVLLDAVESNPEKTEKIIEIARAESEKILKTPSLLKEMLWSRISGLKIKEEEKEQLKELGKKSFSSKLTKNYIQISDAIYGSLFPTMMKTVLETKKINTVEHGEKVNADNIISLSKEYYEKLKNNKSIVEKFGECSITNYREKVVSGVGFAEWWDRDLLEEEKDLLVLYANEDSLKLNDLQYTIIHEMYPGHGQFYNKVAHNNTLMDHGAMSIIEGWATYAEWNTVASEYIRDIRNNALYFLKESLENDVDVKAENMYLRKQKQGYSKDEALRTVIYATQYIGFLEAYYYGALWIEYFLKENNMKESEFIEFLSKKNVGDFFATWKIK